MKKFILAIDGLRYSEKIVNAAISYARIADAHLFGIFLDDISYHSYKMADILDGNGISEEIRNAYDTKDLQMRGESAASFRIACGNANIKYSIHHDNNIAINELIDESTFADLIIIGGNETLSQFTENRPSRFIRSILKESRCPVLVIPEDYVPIEKIAFLYDGEPSSVHAIRTFSYLFPSLNSKNIEVVFVNTNDNVKSLIPQSRLIKEFMKVRFPDISYVILDGIPENEIVKRFQFDNKTMLVTGAYQRGSVSRWFKASLADTLIDELQIPVLVAHT